MTHVNTHDLILAALEGEPKPLLIKEIAGRVGLNRHKVARNLDALEILGRVRKIEIGNAKKYYLVKSIPVSSLIDISVDLILIIDSEYHIQYLNHSAQRFLGIHDRPIMGERLDLLNLDLFSSRKVLNGLKHFTPEKVFRIEIEYQYGNEIQWYSLSIMAISLKSSTYSIALVAEDVTEKKNTESALIASENKFRSIFSAEADAVFLFDQQDGSILEVNTAACTTYGYQYEELLNMKFADLSALEEINTGFPECLTSSHSYVYHKRKDNSIFPVDIRTSSFVIGDHHGTIVTVRDVTERKRMEDELVESEEFANSIFNSVSYGICILDENGVIISVNQRWKDFAQGNHFRDKAHYIGWNYLTVCDTATGSGSEEARQFAAGIRAVMQGDIPLYVQEYECGFQETNRYYKGKVNLLNYAKSGSQRILITHEDITERKLADLATRKSVCLLREVLEYSSDVSYRRNSLTDQYDYLSPSIFQLSGFSIGEFSTLSLDAVFQRIHPDDRDHIETVIRQSITRKKGDYGIEFRFKHKEGHYIWLEDFFSVIYESEDRQFRVGRVRDITEKKRIHEELIQIQNNAAFLSELIELSSLPFVTVYPDGSIGYCNDAFLSLIGYSRDEIKNLNAFHNLITPKWRKQNRTLQDSLSQGASTIVLEKEYIRKDGARIPVEVKVHVKRFPDGSIDFYYGYVTDITERKLAEQKHNENQEYLQRLVNERTIHLEREIEARIHTEDSLRESETRFRSLFTLSPNAIVVYDPDTDRFVDVNPAAERLYGCSHSSLLQRNPREFFLPVPSYEQIVTSFQENTTRVLNGEEVVIERTIVDTAGQHTYCIIQLVRIPYLGKYHIRASFTDITNRKTLEEALHQSNRYNRSLFEAAVDPLTTIGPDGRITDVNAATELMTGYSRHEMIGLDFTTFFSNPRLAHEGFLQVFQDSKIRDYPLEIRHRDGHYTPVLYNATVFRNEEGTIAGVFAAARDVSEQIRINESFRDIEGRFFTVFENSPIGMAILSSSGRCMRVNHALCSLLGYTDEELAIIPFTIYTHPEDLDENVRQFEAVNAGIIDSYILEKRYVRKSGEIIWVQLNVSSVPDKNGVFSYCIAQILDITWRKEGGQGIGSKSQERIP